MKKHEKILIVATALVAGMTFGLEAAEGEKKGRLEGGEGKGKGKGNPAKRVEMMLEKLDTDKSDSISKAEFEAGPFAAKMKEKGGDDAIDKMFAARDKDGDGKLSKKELMAAGGKVGKGGKGGEGRPDGKPEGKKKKDSDS